MRDTQILSGFPETVPAPREQVLVFDACQLGVVLRAVLFVEVCVAVAAMFGELGFTQWVLRLALATGGALPATLAWLLLACLGKRWLSGLPHTLQYGLALALGALCGCYGCWLLNLYGFFERMPWLAGASSGTLLSAVLVTGLVLRAKGRAPADTAARLAELQSRIRPHFLFNTLNSAISLVRAEPARAEALLEDLSDLFRRVLVDTSESVTLSDEIALAQAYLAIEQVRFGERLQVQWSLDPEAEPARLPPLILQPLVENAVRHGVEPSSSGAQLRISTQRRGSVVVIKVSNTLPGGPGVPGAGLALKNVRERLALLHDVQGQFKTSLVDGVYQVRMEVPL